MPITEKDIIAFLNANGYHAWRNQSGKVWLKGNRPMQLAPKGTPDVIGYHKSTGLIVAIERKRDDKTSPEQVKFISEVKQAGGIAGVAKTLEDVALICNLTPR